MSIGSSVLVEKNGPAIIPKGEEEHSSEALGESSKSGVSLLLLLKSIAVEFVEPVSVDKEAALFLL